jgi:hypothetical protein
VNELRLRRDQLQWLVADGEVVALDEATLMYLGANESAGLLWAALAEGTTRSALAERLAAEYGIPPEQAEADVDAFLAQLDERGLLER